MVSMGPVVTLMTFKAWKNALNTHKSTSIDMGFQFVTSSYGEFQEAKTPNYDFKKLSGDL